METPIGNIEIREAGGYITHIQYTQEAPVECDNQSLKEAVKQLDEYFAGSRYEFQLPLAPQGTDFQKKVWKSLMQIPYGETRTYKDIAEMTGNEKACRAVGLANNKNPIMIVVPCHRVIGSNGSLTGYACGVDKKQKLLDLEKNNINK